MVFVSQIGTDGASWQTVIERLTADATTVTYDRPGTGNRPPRPAPNPPLPYSAFAGELADELDRTGVVGPVVLVGHSVGSLIIRVFADRHPDRTAGAIHIDGSIPRLSLWPNAEPTFDGDGPDATEIDAIAGEVEALAAVPPPVPSVVVSRTPGRWSRALPHPAIDDLWSVHQMLLAERWRAPQIVAINAGHLTYIVRFRAWTRPAVRRRVDEYGRHAELIELTSWRQVERLLVQLAEQRKDLGRRTAQDA